MKNKKSKFMYPCMEENAAVEKNDIKKDLLIAILAKMESLDSAKKCRWLIKEYILNL